MSAYLKIPLTILALAGMFAVGLGAAGVGAYYYVAPSLPNAEDLRHVKIAVPLQVFSRDGRLIAEYGEIKRTPVVLRRHSAALGQGRSRGRGRALLRAPGRRLSRRACAASSTRSPRTAASVGGSTITQQVTRTLNVLSRSGLSSGLQRFVNKFKEWILAFRIEREFTKQEILELYLNTYFFGQRSYGVVTAARTYFGKDLGSSSRCPRPRSSRVSRRDRPT